MRGQGSFFDPLLGIDIHVPRGEDLVTSKLPALRTYQHSLEAPANPESVDPAAAARGKLLFEGSAGCVSCHSGPLFTDGGTLHEPGETGMDPTHAERSTTGLYRTTPLRGLWQHAPYFHDGSAATLDDVVTHYDTFFDIGLTDDERDDLVAYLRTL
jgi:cytochrome c peroxidase